MVHGKCFKVETLKMAKTLPRQARADCFFVFCFCFAQVKEILELWLFTKLHLKMLKLIWSIKEPQLLCLAERCQNLTMIFLIIQIHHPF